MIEVGWHGHGFAWPCLQNMPTAGRGHGTERNVAVARAPGFDRPAHGVGPGCCQRDVCAKSGRSSPVRQAVPGGRIRCARGSATVCPYRGMLVAVKVDTMSISCGAKLGDEVRRAARKAGTGISTSRGGACRVMTTIPSGSMCPAFRISPAERPGLGSSERPAHAPLPAPEARLNPAPVVRDRFARCTRLPPVRRNPPPAPKNLVAIRGDAST